MSVRVHCRSNGGVRPHHAHVHPVAGGEGEGGTGHCVDTELPTNAAGAMRSARTLFTVFLGDVERVGDLLDARAQVQRGGASGVSGARIGQDAFSGAA